MAFNGVLVLYDSRTFSPNTPGSSLLTPVDTGTVTSTTPTLDFSGLTSTGDQPIAYEIQIDTVNTFDSSTTTSTSVGVALWGGGGAGSGDTGSIGGSGGGGGAFSEGSQTAVSGTGYTITIGAAGTASTGSGTAGGDTSFINSTTLLAKGGGGGTHNGAGGTGGASASGVGTTKTSGGNGGTGNTGAGGGSGGSGGDLTGGTNGGNAGVGSGGTTGNAGTGTLFAGASGKAGVSTGNGTAGTAPGGAGSGSAEGTQTGGAGSKGQVVVYAPLGTVVSATGGTHTSDATYDYWTFTSSGTWTPTISITAPLVDAKSPTDAGFADITNGSDTTPFASGDTVGYTLQSALTDHTTYYWRVRQIAVPQNNTTYNTAWTATQSFGVSTTPQFTKHHTTDTFKRAKVTKTHTTDTYIGPRRPTKTHTTDVNKVNDFTKFRSHTTDTNKRKAGVTKTHTTDTYTRARLLGATKTHTTDTFKRFTTTRSHTTDTSKFKRVTKTHTTDVYKTPHTTVVTTTYGPAQSSDDAYETTGGGTTSLTDTEIDIEGDHNVGIRFPNITIPQGTTITRAWITWTSYIGASSNFNTSFDGVTVKGEAIDNSPTFAASANNIGARATTTATGQDADAFSNTYTDGVTGLTVTTIVQELLNRGGWTSGNAMSILWLGSGTLSDKFQMYSYDYFSNAEPTILHISTSSTTARTMARRHTTDVYMHVPTATQYTRTHTTDTNKVHRGNPSHTTDVNKRKATLKYHSTDTYLRQSATYTRQAFVSLPTDTTDLSTPFSVADYGTVLADDSTYVNLIGANFNEYLFKWENTSNNQAITITWNGKSTVATSTKTAYLQIYNYNSSAWETIASDSVTAANTDFTLTAKQGISVGHYYTGNFVAARVYQ